MVFLSYTCTSQFHVDTQSQPTIRAYGSATRCLFCILLSWSLCVWACDLQYTHLIGYTCRCMATYGPDMLSECSQTITDCRKQTVGSRRPAQTVGSRRERKNQRYYTFWRQLSEKPSVIPGCPGSAGSTSYSSDSRSCYLHAWELMQHANLHHVHTRSGKALLSCCICWLLTKALHQLVTPYEKVVQHICYIAAQNRLDIIQCGEPSAQDNSPVPPDFEIPNQCCSGPLSIALLQAASNRAGSLCRFCLVVMFGLCSCSKKPKWVLHLWCSKCCRTIVNDGNLQSPFLLLQYNSEMTAKIRMPKQMYRFLNVWPVELNDTCQQQVQVREQQTGCRHQAIVSSWHQIAAYLLCPVLSHKHWCKHW